MRSTISPMGITRSVKVDRRIDTRGSFNSLRHTGTVYRNGLSGRQGPSEDVAACNNPEHSYRTSLVVF